MKRKCLFPETTASSYLLPNFHLLLLVQSKLLVHIVFLTGYYKRISLTCECSLGLKPMYASHIELGFVPLHVFVATSTVPDCTTKWLYVRTCTCIYDICTVIAKLAKPFRYVRNLHLYMEPFILFSIYVAYTGILWAQFLSPQSLALFISGCT